MWEGRQSLGLTDPLGRSDVEDPPNVRTYIMASTQHSPASLPLAAHAPFGNCQQQRNPNPQIWTMRALLTAFTAWVRDGVEPPPSAKPSIADGTLDPPDRVRFPEIPANFYGEVDRPAVSPLRIYDTLHVLDFGPLYRAEDSSGVIVREPPKVGSGSYGILEMQVDADGNDLAGIRSVFLQTPIGTYTGWNLGRKAASRTVCAICGAALFLSRLRRPSASRPAIHGSRSRSATRRRMSISRRLRKPQMISSPSASCCRTMRTRWSRPPRARVRGTLLSVKIQLSPEDDRVSRSRPLT